MENIVDMDSIVETLRAAGFYAYVEQTGGGCATIYASDRADADGRPLAYLTDVPGADPDYPHYLLAAGPGWFDGPGWTAARADLVDFYIGRDDDGASAAVYRGTESDTAESLAGVMIDYMRTNS